MLEFLGIKLLSLIIFQVFFQRRESKYTSGFQRFQYIRCLISSKVSLVKANLVYNRRVFPRSFPLWPTEVSSEVPFFQTFMNHKRKTPFEKSTFHKMTAPVIKMLIWLSWCNKCKLTWGQFNWLPHLIFNCLKKINVNLRH